MEKNDKRREEFALAVEEVLQTMEKRVSNAHKSLIVDVLQIRYNDIPYEWEIRDVCYNTEVDLAFYLIRKLYSSAHRIGGVFLMYGDYEVCIPSKYSSFSLDAKSPQCIIVDGVEKKISRVVMEFLQENLPHPIISANRVCEIVLQEFVKMNSCKNSAKLEVSQDFNWAYNGENYSKYTNIDSSCMTNQDVEKWYKSTGAKVATLLDANDKVLSRCIINKVYGIEENPIYLADCQYGTVNNFNTILIGKLIDGGFIQGHKEIGASCHDAYKYVWNDGTQIERRLLNQAYIASKFSYSEIIDGDVFIPYQDTFKFYDSSNDKMCIDNRRGVGDLYLVDTSGGYEIYLQNGRGYSPNEDITVRIMSSLFNWYEDYFTASDIIQNDDIRYDDDAGVFYRIDFDINQYA